MGKQEVHNLKKIITSAPMYRESKRIIIIDEAHLLNSKEARGAMLTLMEEKSSNFMFILCTTDVSKFDKAFMDRLKSYHFRGASSYDIGQYLINVFNNSDIDDSKVTEEQLKEFTKKGIPLLIENSEGSLRRAVSLLEQCIERSAYTEKQILENLDIVNTDKMIDVFHDVINGSIEKVFEYLEYEVEDLDFFYNYLYKLLYESRIYKHTKKADSDYKEKMYNKLLNKRGENLYNMFIEFEQNKQGYYFNKRLFKSKLLQFMEQSKKLEEVPVRIKKREKA
jgi:DNA polymerase III gamma/tau subunit